MPSPPNVSTVRTLTTGIEVYIVAHAICCLVLSTLAVQAVIAM